MSKKAKAEIADESAVIITDAVLAENQAKLDSYEQSYQGSIKVGHLIQNYRKERNFSAARFAEEIGCAQKTVYRWESGERVPDIPTLMKIAKVLGVSMDDLTRGSK